MRRFVILLLVAIALGLSANSVHAQCAFTHSSKAKKLQVDLVQAFVSCGNTVVKSCMFDAGQPCSVDSDCPTNFPGACVVTEPSRTPNTHTQSGIPSCQPPQTFNEYNGSSPTSWKFDPAKGKGTVQLQAASKAPLNPLNPVVARDVVISLKLTGVIDGNGAAANGVGGLEVVARWTFNDPVNGDMTVQDIPFQGFPVVMVNGQAKLKTTFDTGLNHISQPGYSPCVNWELVSVGVYDSDGSRFAHMGLLLSP